MNHEAQTMEDKFIESLQAHRNSFGNTQSRSRFLETACHFLLHLPASRHFFDNYPDVNEIIGLLSLTGRNNLISGALGKLEADLLTCMDCIIVYHGRLN
jgi:hypothetical protein